MKLSSAFALQCPGSGQYWERESMMPAVLILSFDEMTAGELAI